MDAIISNTSTGVSYIYFIDRFGLNIGGNGAYSTVDPRYCLLYRNLPGQRGIYDRGISDNLDIHFYPNVPYSIFEKLLSMDMNIRKMIFDLILFDSIKIDKRYVIKNINSRRIHLADLHYLCILYQKQL